jgi:hypothetical protein
LGVFLLATAPAADEDTMMSHATVPTLVREIQLPAYGKSPPGPIHTWLQDTGGSFYYSDEFNHHVVSISADGLPRWSIGGKGNAPGLFHYPRGLSLGKVRVGADVLPCIAVSDSWNHRIQFLSLSGTILDIWHKAGGTALHEVVDLCYLSEGNNDEGGCWLVLDRGNHRLCFLSEWGQQLFQVGSPISPGLESRWKKPGLPNFRNCLPDDTLRAFPPYDPIYYPGQVFGHAGGPIFVTEPGTGRLKQLILGSLFPVWKSPRPEMELIAADEWGLLARDLHQRQVSCFDADGSLRAAIEMHGHPLRSDLSSREFWLQTQSGIQRWKLDTGSKHKPAAAPQFELIVRSVETDIDAIAVEPAASAVQALVKAAQEIVALASLFAESILIGAGTRTALEQIFDRIHPLKLGLEQAAKELSVSIHPAYLASHKLQLLQKVQPESTHRECVQRVEEKLRKLCEPIDAMITRGLEWRDEIDMIIKSLMGKDSSDAETEYLGIISGQIASMLEFAVVELSRWCGTGLASLELRVVDKEPDSELTDAPIVRLLRYPARVLKNGVSLFLREVDRISVAAPKTELASRPWGMVQGPDGRIFVSLFQADCILELDSHGHVLACTDPAEVRLRGPLGIGLDPAGRLWIADSFHGAVQVINPMKSGVELSIPCGIDQAQPGTPIGVCSLGNKMLASEVRMQRIFSMSLSGDVEIMCQRFGREPGEFRDPCYIIPGRGKTGKAVWVVDHHNHRIQELNNEGGFLRQLGQCGLGKGKLALPISAAHIDDNTMIIAQWRPFPALKILSMRGEELDMLWLDYDPGGLLLQPGYLWVAEHSGSQIRIYATS